MYQGLGIQGLVQYHPFPQRVKVFWGHRHAKKPFQIQCAMKRCSKDKGRIAFLLRVMALNCLDLNPSSSTYSVCDPGQVT